MSDPETLIQKIQALPPERLREVENVVDFIGAKALRLAVLDRLLTMAPTLEAASIPPLTEDEIQAAVDAVRAERRRNSVEYQCTPQ